MLHVVKSNSRYHPYPKNQPSTLTDETFVHSRFSKSGDAPQSYTEKRARGNYLQTKKRTTIKLNTDQRTALEFLKDKVKAKEQFFVFICGPAGTGKSEVLIQFGEFVRREYGWKESCEITGPTGMSSVLVGGLTFHTVLGLMPLVAPFTQLTPQKLMKMKEELRHLEVLVIDEISLVTSTTMAQLDFRLQEVFTTTKPFGGKSVVVFGDLLQLPPVSEKNQNERIFTTLPYNLHARYRTMAPLSPLRLWDLFEMVELTINMRSNSRRASEMLSEIRLGQQSDQIKQYIQHHCRMVGETPEDIFREVRLLQNEDPEKRFMVLAPTVEQVKELNDWKMSQTKNVLIIEPIEDCPLDVTTPFFRKAEKKAIKTTIGSVVMITVNINVKLGIVNGVMGTVDKITREHVVIKRIDKDVTIALKREPFQNKAGNKFYQFPLTEAEAITIHKSQGMTFDGVVIVNKKMTKVGSFYTALSRARSLRLTRITNTENLQWSACKRSIDKLEQMRVPLN